MTMSYKKSLAKLVYENEYGSKEKKANRVASLLQNKSKLKLIQAVLPYSDVEAAMKEWKVVIEITGLGGTRQTEHTIQAMTEKVAIRRAYAIIGDQTGHIVSINGKAF